MFFNASAVDAPAAFFREPAIAHLAETPRPLHHGEVVFDPGGILDLLRLFQRPTALARFNLVEHSRFSECHSCFLGRTQPWRLTS
jgi:hypothetical protein